MEKNNDFLIWIEFKKGSKNALNKIFLENYDYLFGYGIKLKTDNEFIKDCIQDLFLKLWKNRERLNEVNSIKLYLLKSLRRLIIDKLSSKSKLIFKKPFCEKEFDIEYSHEDFIINNERSNEIKNKLNRALNNLPKRQRETIYLRYFEGLSIKDISEIMSLKVQCVRNNIYKGLKTLKDIISS